MTVLYIDYVNKFEALSFAVQMVDFCFVIIGLIMGLLFITINKSVASTVVGIFIWIIAILAILDIIKMQAHETNYIKEEWVTFHDESAKADVFDKWEIKKVKGDIYILVPRDGKRIKEKEVKDE